MSLTFPSSHVTETLRTSRRVGTGWCRVHGLQGRTRLLRARPGRWGDTRCKTWPSSPLQTAARTDPVTRQHNLQNLSRTQRPSSLSHGSSPGSALATSPHSRWSSQEVFSKHKSARPCLVQSPSHHDSCCTWCGMRPWPQPGKPEALSLALALPSDPRPTALSSSRSQPHWPPSFRHKPFDPPAGPLPPDLHGANSTCRPQMTHRLGAACLDPDPRAERPLPRRSITFHFLPCFH